VEGYISDKEQIQIIKDWWKKYGNIILIAFILVFGASFGWRYWHYYKNKQGEQASILYEQMLSTDNQAADFKLFAEHLIKDYSHTPYASLASLMLAKQDVANSNLSGAVTDLQWVVKHGNSKSFRQIARIREARVLLANKQIQAALQLLQKVDDKAFMPAIEETKGDIFLAQDDKTKALDAYKQALQMLAPNSVMQPILTMKINQITK
jgi:predicted negative regulator of RcsB-dependent stress response